MGWSRNCGLASIKQPACLYVRLLENACPYTLSEATMFRLSDEYEAIYDNLLATIAANTKVSHEIEQSLFWPMRGHQYDGDLLIIGRDPYGTDVHGKKREFQLTADRRRKIMDVRHIAEQKNLCPMYWLTEFRRKKPALDPELHNWKFYNWKGSAFFRVMNRVSLLIDPKRGDEWASWLCYSNLLKVGKPTSLMINTQLSDGIRLLQQEIAEFCPHRVLVLTGKERFIPFAEKLGLNVRWRTGYVEGVAVDNDRQWVIAKHPMCKPEDVLVDEVLKAFAGQWEI